MKIGGANAPPNSLTKLRKRGFGRVSAARVWPGGYTLLVVIPGFAIYFYLQLDLQFKCNAPIPRIRGRHCNVYT